MARFVELSAGRTLRFERDFLLVLTGSERSSTRSLVILVHGLNGAGPATWAALLDSPDWQSPERFDLAVVNYRSGLRRIARVTQHDAEEIAENLASEINQLSPRKIVLVGHSMGGLIAKETLRRLRNDRGTNHHSTQSIRGIITVCTPSAGSGSANSMMFLPALRRDWRILRRQSRFQREVERFFASYVHAEITAPNADKLHVPVFAARARSDLVVNSMGATLGVPLSQSESFDGGHSTVLQNQALLDWLHSTAVALIERPPTAPTARESLRTEFNGSGAHPSWEGAYNEALDQHQAEYGPGSILGWAGLAPSRDPHLVVRAFSAVAPLPGVPSDVLHDVRRQEESAAPQALGISPVGDFAGEAVLLLEKEIGAPRNRWFRGTTGDDQDLVAIFREFFVLTSTGRQLSPHGHHQRLSTPDGDIDDEV